MRGKKSWKSVITKQSIFEIDTTIYCVRETKTKQLGMGWIKEGIRGWLYNLIHHWLKIAINLSICKYIPSNSWIWSNVLFLAPMFDTWHNSIIFSVVWGHILNFLGWVQSTPSNPFNSTVLKFQCSKPTMYHLV